MNIATNLRNRLGEEETDRLISVSEVRRIHLDEISDVFWQRHLPDIEVNRPIRLDWLLVRRRKGGEFLKICQKCESSCAKPKISH